MRDMMEKFGTEVQSFRYAFVMPRHAPGWDEAKPAPRPTAPPALAGGKPPVYIEVKPRLD
jgi:hypothetical protein